MGFVYAGPLPVLHSRLTMKTTQEAKMSEVAPVDSRAEDEFDPTKSAFRVAQQTIRLSAEAPRPARPVDLAKLRREAAESDDLKQSADTN